MAQVTITLPDGSTRNIEAGTKFADIAASISRSLADKALAVSVDGVLRDLMAEATADCSLQFVTFDSEEGVDLFWHSAAHLLAQAVTRLFPEAKYTIGPSIDTGFYYDFDCDTVFTPEVQQQIEAEMAKIVSENISVERREVSRDEAIALFKERGNHYKVEILEALPAEEIITFYQQGDFIDLCRGPHIPRTGLIKAFKLTSLAGAYWRGDEKNKMLQRIYGVAFPKKKLLDEHLARIEEAKKRDHRKIGKELDLFSFHEEGPGFPFWHPKGTALYNIFMDYIRSANTARGYSEIMTPIILNDDLWHKSGHWDNFKENMYFTEIDEQSYAVKPMNCPGGLLIYKNSLHSYRELPIRNAEMGLVHRHEKSGVLHGLFRVRSFTQDDAHVFCTPEQIQSEVREIIDYTISVYRDFGFEDISVFVATRPEKSIGSDSDWEMATASLKEALAESGLSYKVKEGEGAFYGPKIEFNIKDCLGRNWQCGTVQVDFSMPSRFNVTYRGSDGKDHVPVMVHRAIFGSLERFIAITIEHFGGKFPLWLAPVQVAVLSISDKVIDYSQEVADLFMERGFRVETNFTSESLGNKIRLARNRRVPYILILGEKEAQTRTISMKTYNDGNAKDLQIEELVAILQDAVTQKSLKTILEG